MSIKPAVLIGFAVAGVITYRALRYDPHIATVNGVLSKSYPTTKGEQKDTTDPIRDSVNKVGGVVLGKATSYVSDVASNSAGVVEDFVIESAVGGVVKQIEKLPERQQEKIKEILCK